MELRYLGLLLALAFCSTNPVALAQSRSHEIWQAIEPQTVTLCSRARYKDQSRGYGQSTFSFKYGVRSDVGGEITGNNYDLQYGNISLNKDSDWFSVTMVTDDRSRIKDLGELNWSDISVVPYLPASIEPPGSIRMPSKSETFEESTNGQVTRVVAGHMYIVHSKDSGSDIYALLRVERLVPSDEVTISWKVVPSPEK